MGVSKPELHAAVAIGSDVALCLGNDFTIAVGDVHGDNGFVAYHATVKLGVDSHHGSVVLDFEGANVGAPSVEGHAPAGNEFHGAVEASTRIPAAALLKVLEMNLEIAREVIVVDVRREVNAEGVVAVAPAAHFLDVEVDDGLAHDAVKEQLGTLGTCWQHQLGLIVSLAYPGQRTRAATVLGGGLLAILLDGYHLQVPFLVKWSTDCPVVGNCHVLPLQVVAAELPLIKVDNLGHISISTKRHSSCC